MAHSCHARGCAVAVPPRMLMCRKHWFMVPALVRDRVWREYRPAQERDRNPSRDYLAAAEAAIDAIELAERGPRLKFL